MKFLLVGLGGSGSKVVDRVCSMVSQSDEYRNKVQFVCMDTDENDGKKLKNLSSVRTSSDTSIEDYLNHIDGWQQWFPDDPMLRLKDLKDGASQIRATSRLALDSAVSAGKMANLKKAIDELLKVDEDADTTIKVMVVCSLAGGTGSGIFLQIPDLIKKYLGAANKSIIIRGLLMMPDIFKETVDDPVQKESVLANTYAAFRELNAINKACATSKEIPLGYTMAINDFNTSSDQGKPAKIPYNLIFAIDRKNQNGQIITNIDLFLNQAANIVMMQFFSPLVQSQFSKEDNRYLNLIQTKGKNIYGTAGTAKLVYPYEDIMSYCAACSVLDSIDKKWMHFDQIYADEFKNYEKERKVNPATQKPDINKTVIENVERELLSEEQTIFSYMKRELLSSTGGADGNINRVDTYYAKIFNYVKDLPASDIELDTFKVNSTIQSSQINKLNKRDTARKTISLIEENLKDYKTAVDNFVGGSIAFRAVNAIIWADYDAAEFEREGFEYYTDQFKLNENGEYSIYNLLTIDDQYISPMSARYAIYKLIAKIDESLKFAEAQLIVLDSEIEEYQDSYDDPDTPIVEDAVNIAKNYESEGLRKKIIGGSAFKGFIKKYISWASEQNQRISDYAEYKIFIKVFKEVKSKLVVLAEEYTSLFNSLRAVKTQLENDIEHYANANTESKLIKYIFGSKEEKAQIYDDIKAQYEASDSLNNTINQQINQSLYVEASKKIKQKNESVSTFRKIGKQKSSNEYLSRMFSETVIDAARADFINQCEMNLNKDIGTLLFEKYEDNETVQEELKKIANLATPLLSYTQNGKAQMYDVDGQMGTLGTNIFRNTYWVMNPEVHDAFSLHVDDIGTYLSVLGDETGRPDISIADDFSQHVIIFYNAVYGLEINDINLLNEESGECYLAYERRISQLNGKGIPFGAINDEDSVIITPHLDLRWHNTLPYISSLAEKKERYKKDLLLLYALAYGKIQLFNLEDNIDPDHKYYYNVRQCRVIEYEGKPIREDYAFQLREASYGDRTLARGLEQTLTKAYHDDISCLPNVKKEDHITELGFVKGLSGLDEAHINICDFLFNYRSSASDNQTEKYEEYLSTLTTILKNICEEISKEHRETMYSEIKKYWFNNSKISEKTNGIEYTVIKSWVDMAWDD